MPTPLNSSFRFSSPVLTSTIETASKSDENGKYKTIKPNESTMSAIHELVTTENNAEDLQKKLIKTGTNVYNIQTAENLLKNKEFLAAQGKDISNKRVLTVTPLFGGTTQAAKNVSAGLSPTGRSKDEHNSTDSTDNVTLTPQNSSFDDPGQIVEDLFRSALGSQRSDTDAESVRSSTSEAEFQGTGNEPDLPHPNSVESVGTQTMGLQGADTGDANPTEANTLKTNSAGHTHRKSDQLGLIITSLAFLFNGITSLVFALVERGKSSSDASLTSDIDGDINDLSDQMAALETNAEDIDQIQNMVNNYVEECDNDAAKLAETSQTLASYKEDIQNKAGEDVYKEVLNKATALAYEDPNNQTMTTNSDGTLVPTGQLTEAVQQACEQQAVAAQQAASDLMGKAIDSIVDGLNNKVVDINTRSQQGTVTSNELGTLSATDRAIAADLSNQIASLEETENSMVNEQSGPSAACVDFLIASGSTQIAGALALTGKYYVNRKHNQKADRLAETTSSGDSAWPATSAVDSDRSATIEDQGVDSENSETESLAASENDSMLVHIDSLITDDGDMGMHVNLDDENSFNL